MEAVNGGFERYVMDITGGASLRAVADRAGIDASTLTRQVRGATGLRIETVVAVCRAYDAPILPALVAASWLSRDEAEDAAQGGGDIATAPDGQLLRELLRRAERPSNGLVSAVSEVPDNVSPLPIPAERDLRGAANREPEWNPDDHTDI